MRLVLRFARGFRSRLACAAGALAFMGGVARAGDGPTAAVHRPICLVGAGYGRSECAHLAESILRPERLVFEDAGGTLPVGRLGEFGLVVVCSAVDRPLTDEEVRGVDSYLRGGGQVLLVNSVSYSMFARRSDTAAVPWVGARRVGWLRGGDTVTVVNASNAFVGHVRPETLDVLGRAGAAASGPTSMTPLIAGPRGIVVGVNAVGKGTLWFCGPESFRLHGASVRKMVDKAERAKASTADEDYRRVLRAIIVQAGTLTAAQDIATHTAGLPDPVLWYRDPGETARGGAYLQPSYPVAGETVGEVALDLCQGETESARFYVTCRKAQPSWVVRPGDLRGDTGGCLRAEDVRVRLQGLPAPELARVGPYWLLDGRPDGAGGRVFELAGGSTHTLWITLRTDGLAPGEYRGTLRVEPGGAVPLRVKVWPVPLPSREYFAASATTHWTSLPGGDYTRKTDVALYERFIADMGEHLIDCDCPAGLVAGEGSRLLDRAVLREDGTPLPEALKREPERFRSGALPALDLSAFDPYSEVAGRHGLIRILIPNRNDPGDYLEYARAIYGNRALPADSPEHARVRTWCRAEVTQFFRERGYRTMYAFLRDEQAPAMIPELTARGRDVLTQGWAPCATITGATGSRADYYRALNPGLSYWILNMVCVDDFWREFRSHPDMIDSGDRLGTYVADWHRAAYAFNRKYGWFCPYFRLDRWMVHGYLRWYPDGGAVWPTPQGPVATEGWEGVRDGIEDGRLFAMLIRLTEALERTTPKSEALEAQCRAARAAQQRLVGRSADCLIPLEENRSHAQMPYLEAKGSERRLREARRLVLEHLSALRAQWDFSRRSLRWGDLQLADRGVARVAVVPGPHREAGERLAARLGALIGGPVPVTNHLERGVTPIYLGCLADNAALAQVASAEALGVTGRYPGPGHCLMLQFDAAGGPAVALYATDAAGLAKAVEIWPNYLEADDGLPPYDRVAFARSLPAGFLPEPPAARSGE